MGELATAKSLASRSTFMPSTVIATSMTSRDDKAATSPTYAAGWIRRSFRAAKILRSIEVCSGL